MTQDQGNRFVRQSVPEAKPLILIHHWGAPRHVVVDSSAQGDHIVGHDITVRWTPNFYNVLHLLPLTFYR